MGELLLLLLLQADATGRDDGLDPASRQGKLYMRGECLPEVETAASAKFHLPGGGFHQFGHSKATAKSEHW